MNDTANSTAQGEGSSWVPRPAPTTGHPHMTDDFARVYEQTANRNTGQIAAAALDRVGDIGWGTRILDIQQRQTDGRAGAFA
jgi:hypothetical protein